MNGNSYNSEVKLQRVLKLRDLVIYGIILIQPGASLALFGHANNLSKGHAVTTILVAMVAMILTAISYGRMANRYPSAGSAYTYVGRGLNPVLGFIAGWCMFLDYLIVPIICIIYSSITANHLLPIIPYEVWIFFFMIIGTFINLRGIKFTSLTNKILLVIMSMVIFYFMAAMIRYIFVKDGLDGLFTIQPFYNKDNFSWNVIWTGTSLAALTYIGFDGLTTLSEEVENPRRNVLLATVLTCLITGVWSGSQVYLAQASYPGLFSTINAITDETVKNHALDTAIMTVANKAGGIWLDSILSLIILIAHIGSNITGQAGASRLLYGMGRDNVLPKKFFGHLDRKFAEPSYNIILIAIISLISAFVLNYEECARLINFGAFLAFIGVNLTVIREYYFRAKEKTIKSFFINFFAPAVGSVICFYIWRGLPFKTFVVGGVWMIVGIGYLAIRTKGFSEKIKMIDYFGI
jgi:amino acid transporter